MITNFGNFLLECMDFVGITCESPLRVKGLIINNNYNCLNHCNKYSKIQLTLGISCYNMELAKFLQGILQGNK